MKLHVLSVYVADLLSTQQAREGAPKNQLIINYNCNQIILSTINYRSTLYAYKSNHNCSYSYRPPICPLMYYYAQQYAYAYIYMSFTGQLQLSQLNTRVVNLESRLFGRILKPPFEQYMHIDSSLCVFYTTVYIDLQQ